MRTKKLLSFLLAIVMVASAVATMGITAGAIATDATPVYVGETYDRVEFVSSVTTFSDEEQDGNIWYFYTTDETVLKVVNYYIEEDAVEGDKLHVFLKGIAVGNGLEILCKQYDAESTSWVDGVSAINGIYNVVPAPVYLDLDENTTEILEKKELNQNYNLTVNETGYEDVTKVKLTWEIKDINATRTDNKVWDTTELKWVVASSNTTINQVGSAKFTLENYSSVKVDAIASFEATSDLTPTVEYSVTDGTITLDTAADDDTYSKTNVPTGEITVTVTPSEGYFIEKTATTAAVQYGIYTVTIAEHEDDECLAKGTKITMADGSLKNIEDITVGEQVLTFNHESGKYEAQAVDLAYAGEGKDYGTELTFSDGTTLTIVGKHDLFRQESMKYVTVTRTNAKASIGKHFYNAVTGKFAELTSVRTTAPVNYYSIYTKNNYNCIANGMLTVPDDVDYMLNIYEFNNDLTANEAQLQKDIATYGIYEYRTDAPYSKAEYDMMNMKYVNIVIGKGLATFDALFGVRDEYLELR